MCQLVVYRDTGAENDCGKTDFINNEIRKLSGENHRGSRSSNTERIRAESGMKQTKTWS